MEGFRVKPILRRKLANGKRRLERRLDKSDLRGCERPAFTARNIDYDIADRVHGMAHGGIGAMHLLARRIGLIDAIDQRLHLLKIHLPYHESDHVLNLAYNALCDGTCLQDLELRRQDEVFLDALGARRIPDPTTAGDFCRRFQAHHVHTLIDIYNEVRQRVWARQPAAFFEQARIDMDGTLVPTDAECKGGVDIAYDGTWGYHALVVSLANTGEVLSVVNRPGNRPSHEGAAAEVDRALRVCLEGGFRRVLLRGDTDFSQTQHLDRWTADARVQFIFGLDTTAARHVLADDLAAGAWQPLERPARYEVKTQPRARPERVKEQIVRDREFKNIRLESEEVAELQYRPVACRNTYRLIVVRKRATEGRRARLAGARRRSGEQLGLHGDGVVGLEPESMVGVVADGNSGALGRAPSARERNGVAHGVQNVRQRLHAAAEPDHPHGPTVDLPLAQLEPLERDVLPRPRPATLLTQVTDAGVRMLRSPMAP
jgi:hypothetical protein